MMQNFSYVRPKTLKEAVKQLSSEGSGVLAGGTDLLGCLRDRVFEAKKLVSLAELSGLRGITKTADGGVRIGALATVTETATNKLIRDQYPGLSQAVLEVASPQLRNQGTMAGNLCQKPRCWYYRGEFHCLRKGGELCFAATGENQFHCILGGGPCYIVHPSDTAPALAAFGASVTVLGPKGPRSVPVERLFVLPETDPHKDTVLSPAELITEIILPPQRKGTRSSFRKVRARNSWDFAVAAVALSLVVEGDTVERARVVLGGAAPVPWRSLDAENALIGRKLGPEEIEKAAAAAVKGAQPLGQNEYKVGLFRRLIEEELTKLARA